MVRTEIEIDPPDHLEEVLDNMDTSALREAVTMTGGRLALEASGNMHIDRITEVAATGVDNISQVR